MKQHIQRIVHDLEELKDLIAYFENYEDTIPAIEIDLALSKLRDIYDDTIKLATGFGENRKPLSLPKPVSTVHPTIIQEPKSNEIKEINEKITLGGEGKKMQTVSEKFISSSVSLNENLALKKKTTDINTRLKSKRIEDIAKALGVNDKYVLTKELFKGNRGQLNETIEILNQFDSYEDAVEYITTNFTWDIESEPVQLLLEVVKRKFI